MASSYYIVLFLVVVVLSVSALTVERAFALNKADDSCVGRCNTMNQSMPCQCNTLCSNYGDCCTDYQAVCEGEITDEELAQLSEELLRLDANNVAQFLSLELQNRTTNGDPVDRAPLPMLTLLDGALVGPTISTLVALYDNYFAEVELEEIDTGEELAEREAFIDALFETSVMQRTQEFLVSKGLPNGREVFEEIWFDYYKRPDNGSLGSSGFEHVFLGELWNGVSGFHNWIYFAYEESNGNLNYRGWMNFVDMGTRGSIVENNFVWRNQSKPISSSFIGASPEFELALFTVCFYARSNDACPISLSGQTINIQTYEKLQNGKVYVSTSYADISGYISDADLAELSEELVLLDVNNNLAEHVTVNIQGLTSQNCGVDDALLPLLTLADEAYAGPTISRLMALHDNYIPETGPPENDTPEELLERANFIEAIFLTPVMQRTQEFLISRGLPNGVEDFHRIWFEYYTRSSDGALGSSGFEHVFLGEITSNGVSGFHNWLYFAREEENGNLDYKGYLNYLDLEEKGSIVEHNFVWRNNCKPISDVFIATPELELALYTICFYARKNSLCPVSLNGKLVHIQTYEKIENNGTLYVSTSYPVLSVPGPAPNISWRALSAAHLLIFASLFLQLI